MSLSRLRIEDISIYNYIKYEILGLHFVEQLQNQTLEYNSSLGMYLPSYEDLEPSPVSKGRGWVLFDEVSDSIDISQEQSNRVVVSGATTYEVNYVLGAIRNPDTTPTSVSYYWNYVSVVDGWPGTNTPDLPIVAIDIESGSRDGFQLGGGYRSSRGVDIHVFATTNGERDDITDTLFDNLYNRRIPVIDYSQGDYLDHNGFYDNSFAAPQLGTAHIYFDNVQYRTVNNPSDWSDLNQYRSVISLTAVSFIE